MGMSTGGHKGGVQSDINVTPLIDVLLVLLIIFLVVMPIMMKMETLQVPRKIDNEQEMPDPNASQLTVKAKVGGDYEFDDGNGNPITVPSADLLRTIRPKLEAMSTGTEKVFFDDCPIVMVSSSRTSRSSMILPPSTMPMRSVLMGRGGWCICWG